jgi:16S rRNA (guanine966-N2)-methyltransferase
MRIVGGKFAGRDLTSPNDFRVRPTAEHVRDAIAKLVGGALKDARVLDLFAGTGALGLEALSRGAQSCDFVETRPSSLHALRANVAALRVRDRVRVFKRDALPFAAALGEAAYDVAFVDPPYESRMLDRVIDSWRDRRFARLMVVEHAARHVVPRGVRQLTFDDTTVTLYEC